MPVTANIKKSVDTKGTNKQKGKKTCTCCHIEKDLVSGFYISHSPIFSIDKRLPVCKACISDMCVNKETGEIDEIELNKCLRKFDKPYYKDSLFSAYSQFKKEHSFIEDDEIKLHGKEIVQLYFKNISMRQTVDKSYEDSENEGFTYGNSNTLKTQRSKITSAFGDVVNGKNVDESIEKESKKISWSKQDTQNKKYAIDVVGYDPFEDYPEEGRKFLFNQLSPYLEDDSNADDAYKLSQILQIVKNNYQIDTCDKQMSQLEPLKDAESFKTLNEIKNKLVQSNDKIAKENEISVKNRSNKDAGKSTLTYLMRDLREKDFDRAESDYYDQLKGTGTQWAIDMSIKSIKQNGMFDENDKKEIYEMQLDLISKLNKENDDLKEQVRLLLEKIDLIKAGEIDG